MKPGLLGGAARKRRHDGSFKFGRNGLLQCCTLGSNQPQDTGVNVRLATTSDVPTCRGRAGRFPHHYTLSLADWVGDGGMGGGCRQWVGLGLVVSGLLPPRPARETRLVFLRAVSSRWRGRLRERGGYLLWETTATQLWSPKSMEQEKNHRTPRGLATLQADGKMHSLKELYKNGTGGKWEAIWLNLQTAARRRSHLVALLWSGTRERLKGYEPVYGRQK